MGVRSEKRSSPSLCLWSGMETFLLLPRRVPCRVLVPELAQPPRGPSRFCSKSRRGSCCRARAKGWPRALRYRRLRLCQARAVVLPARRLLRQAAARTDHGQPYARRFPGCHRPHSPLDHGRAATSATASSPSSKPASTIDPCNAPFVRPLSTPDSSIRSPRNSTANPDDKSDPNDVAAVFRAATQGFGLQ